MSLAVVNHADLVQFTDDLGFPKYTKVQLAVGGIGHQYFDQFIRTNVRWINMIDFDPTTHVPITESAHLSGEIPEHWGLRTQQFLEGTEESNTFKAIGADIDGEWIEIGSHVNRAAIIKTVGTAELKYKVEYQTDSKGMVLNNNHLAVAVFEKAEDTSLSYTTELPVESIWTTQVQVLDDDRKILQKRCYAHDPVVEESYPWIDVGVLTEEEYEIWKLHNLKPEEHQNWQTMDFRGISDIEGEATRRIEAKGIAHLAS